MRSLFTTATLLTLSSLGAALWTGALRAVLPAPPKNPGEAPSIMPAEISDQVDPKTARAIRGRLADIVNHAATVDGFNELVGDLAKANRDRMGTAQPRDYSTLNARIETFRKYFHDKYQQDFAIQSVHFNDLKIYRGADQDHATLNLTSLNLGLPPENPGGQPLSNYHGPGHPRDSAGESRSGASPIGNADLSIETKPGALQTLVGANPPRLGGAGSNDGVNVGLLAPLQLNLVNENTMGHEWRLEAVDGLTAAGLCEALSQHFKVLCDSRNAWPTDVHEAYRAVAGHVFQTLEEVPAANISSEK